MLRSVVLLIALIAARDGSAQLMTDHIPNAKPMVKTRVASEVPAALAGNATLRFEMLDICFDGGSHGGFFKRDNGSKLILFFPNPAYWSADAKRESKQPVAIQGKTLVEIAVDSPLQERILELIANDIADGQRDRDATLTLIRIRDCLLHRQPLTEIIELYDPDTWEPRAEKFSFGDDDPLGNATSNADRDEPSDEPKSQ